MKIVCSGRIKAEARHLSGFPESIRAHSAGWAAQTLNRGNGAEPDSLDPQFAGGTAEENILNDLMVGLTTLDAGGRPIPGIADRWTVSPDGLRWTFHLRSTPQCFAGCFV